MGNIFEDIWKATKRAGGDIIDAAGKVVEQVVHAANDAKDTLLSAFIRELLINNYIKKYGGKMISFKMDTTDKQIDLSAELLGELQPLDFKIKYDIYHDKGHTFIEATSIQSSREWISLLLAELIKAKTIQPVQVPAGIAQTALKVLGI